jgi:hypothetical protein
LNERELSEVAVLLTGEDGIGQAAEGEGAGKAFELSIGEDVGGRGGGDLGCKAELVSVLFEEEGEGKKEEEPVNSLNHSLCKSTTSSAPVIRCSDEFPSFSGFRLSSLPSSIPQNLSPPSIAFSAFPRPPLVSPPSRLSPFLFSFNFRLHPPSLLTPLTRRNR